MIWILVELKRKEGTKAANVLPRLFETQAWKSNRTTKPFQNSHEDTS